MIYEHIAPSLSLSRFIKSYWLIDSEGDATQHRQKIIPDGYPELIFHYGDPYRINIDGEWYTQESELTAGQIRKHFFLENTGKSGMIGIKLMPTSLTQLFGIDMSLFKDNVKPISTLDIDLTQHLPKASLEGKDLFINSFEDIVKNQLSNVSKEQSAVEVAVLETLNTKGGISISKLCQEIGISERHLERQFSKYVGLSPKFYARIVRFAHIFELMQNQDNSWSDLVYASGFYDQSHFIKNFKEFTGEDPSAYGFNEKNMANFHLNQ
ncbi:helix-turn-helix domain-containing protein [Roseivirga sp. E12]|uniref:helix-turn-helix domain-containing protein n=1 Tax=Roseivirga sp. E12 TaxID=2819237 RepID=UPI001ABC9D2F|nr:helix-turn-helix domain-containing protein [Roseivirga sp. E12]MBO3697426.1 AraC family transcriptional regulator [Roseivirga sp. E12]